MRIALDIDGVLTQSCELIADRMIAEGHDITLADVERWILYEKSAINDVIRDWYMRNHQELRRAYEAYPGSRAIISLMANHELLAITNRVSSTGDCPATRDWLAAQHLPLRKVVFTETSKAQECTSLGVDVIIEDNPSNALACAEAGVQVLLFDKSYNQGIEHPRITRFSHWLEVPRRVEQLRSQLEGPR